MRTTVTVKVTVPVLLLSCIHELEFFEIIKMKSKMSVHLHWAFSPAPAPPPEGKHSPSCPLKKQPSSIEKSTNI